MKMENEITAHKAGVIAELPITEGVAVAAGDTLAIIKSASGENGAGSDGASGG
jgi:acetyl-CoA/propionyl-CoA carboxylase biotin carboxyl carrier protein